MSNLVNSFAMGSVTVAVEPRRRLGVSLPLFDVFPSRFLGNLAEDQAKSKQLFIGFAIKNFYQLATSRDPVIVKPKE